MKPKVSPFALALCLATTCALADAGTPLKVEDDHGVLNPDDTGKEMIVRKIEMGIIDSVTCSLGINVTKNDDHQLARKLTRECAEAGFTKAMTWMSQLEDNGLGGEYNPDASAEWDRRAAEAGDPVGKFNHGLNLMRGHGIAQDDALGRQFVDEAANDGLPIAKRLQAAGYDLDEVTPDADNWKYAPMF
ncbi:tetratricopeptide repeat protein [Roseobacter sinensis]|uniref:Sel1 repeat family protein n=1 Tax=Roseobacter sinensis TaxID=2931391 RepID=A0ABT3BIG6_9RHOB|nr:sel1 repeat family protein [Roseobacter sp. WL0113]MCV3273367.1 sel1 repeat family protein [Roseobacter sp. WL0113]